VEMWDKMDELWVRLWLRVESGEFRAEFRLCGANFRLCGAKFRLCGANFRLCGGFGLSLRSLRSLQHNLALHLKKS